MKRPNLLKACLIIPVCLLSLAQCGLEYLPYLTPPESLVPLTTAFKVRKTAANDSEFVVGEWEYKGIELYYKLYEFGTVPDADRNLTEFNELTLKGYLRISSYPDDKKNAVLKPLMEIAGSWVNDVDFSIDLDEKKIKEIVTTTELVSDVRRGVPYNDSETGAPFFQRFEWNDGQEPYPGFDESEADVGTALYTYMNTYTLSNITMIMYALSYGKIDDLYDLHSEAVYLGEININFGW
ncbi:MAG: hypothetical protein JSV89_07185 [Spirochaetaceae bacterium]|nr:MAG: hypothetical protein JSV89_07185 [Spirochaetaceae bacterium]